MSKWRRLAIEVFPDQRQEFQRSETTIYGVLGYLRGMLPEYHKTNDLKQLQKIYGYAEWCWSQWNRSYYLGNAAGVGFYEHLVDNPVTLEAIPYWVKPYIFKDMMGLFEWMLQKKPEEFEGLVKRYNMVNGTSFSLPKSEVILNKPKPKRKTRDGRIYQSRRH